jgi:hypothetical protein
MDRGRILFVFIILLAVCGCSPIANCNGGQNNGSTLHILFIGNSYTYANDLPGNFARLACAGGHEVETDMAAEGGWALADHAASAQTFEKLGQQKWDFVILQEQSEIPVMDFYRKQSMYPAARQLVGKIKAMGAKPILLMTWGLRDGLPQAGLQNFNDMQAQLYVGYMGIAKELNVPVAPVGDAWLMGRLQPTPLDLWQADGSHPNEMGTYLAACVFYAAIFRQSPAELTYRSGLSQETAQTLQTLAADSVLKEPWRWNLP